MNPSTRAPENLHLLLHLCDSLFPIGGFAYSDGLEAAPKVRLTAFAKAPAVEKPDATYETWLDVCLDETFTRLEGPAVRHAWNACNADEWDALAAIDREVTALRPSSTARRASRAMGMRLLATWTELHSTPRLDRAVASARAGLLAPSLPVAFGIACAEGAIGRRDAITGYAYSRLAATASAAMRLMPIGQLAAHRALARTLERVPAAVDVIETSSAALECFTPLMDIAAMTQQFLESKLFRS